MSHDQTRQALNGILLEVEPVGGDEADLRLIATDGHRLAFIQRRCRAAVVGQRGVIVPRKAITEVRKLIGEENIGSAVEISFSGKSSLHQRRCEPAGDAAGGRAVSDYHQVIPTGARGLPSLNANRSTARCVVSPP